MAKPKILIVWSNYYGDLAKRQLESCLFFLDHSNYGYHVETVDSGAYEIPTVIRYYHQHQPYQGYLPLGLVLKGSTDHYEFIWEHIKECFIRFAMEGILIGNGIITASTRELLIARVENQERVEEAFRAVDYLIRLQEKFKI